MAKYSVTVRATTNGTANTEDTMVDLDAAAGQQVKIYRIRVSPQAATNDTHFRVKIARKSAIGSGSVAGTEVKLNPVLGPTSATAATIKTGTTAYGAGTITDTIDDAIHFNGRGSFEWVARDDDDMLCSTDGGIIGVNIFNSGTSQTFACTVYWIE